MWAIIQKRVDVFGPSDAEELWQFVKRAWDEIDMSIVKNLCGFFPGRLRKCIRAGGNTIATSTKRMFTCETFFFLPVIVSVDPKCASCHKDPLAFFFQKMSL